MNIRRKGLLAEPPPPPRGKNDKTKRLDAPLAEMQYNSATNT